MSSSFQALKRWGMEWNGVLYPRTKPATRATRAMVFGVVYNQGFAIISGDSIGFKDYLERKEAVHLKR